MVIQIRIRDSESNIRSGTVSVVSGTKHAIGNQFGVSTVNGKAFYSLRSGRIRLV